MLSLENIQYIFSEVHGLADGGYLMWCYGVKHGYRGWNHGRLKFEDHLIFLDHDSTWRRDIFPGYKERRKERRAESVEQREKTERVREFKELMSIDGTVMSAAVEGCEADDLISLFFLLGIGNESVVGVDKDLFQIPGLSDVMMTHKDEPSTGRFRKLPKYVTQTYGHPKESWEFILTQALFGDKSDSIPRLLSSKGWEARSQYMQLRPWPSSHGKEVFETCHASLGQDFIRNILLVLLPAPWIREDVSYLLESMNGKPEYLFESIVSGDYWTNLSPYLSSGVIPKVVDRVLDPKDDW